MGVSNFITIKSRVQNKDVVDKITAALHRQAQIDARRIWITINDGTVVLHGQVSSWSEAQAARQAAAAAPGVKGRESARDRSLT